MIFNVNIPKVGEWAVGVAMALAFAAIFWAIRWDGHFHDQKGCVQLQSVQSKLYRVNTCSGEVVELKSNEIPQQAVPRADVKS